MLARPHRSGKTSRLSLIVVAAATVFLATTSASAQRGAQCPASKTPIKLNFKTLAPAPVHSHRLSLNGIGKVARTQGADGGDGRTVGLTTLKTMYGIQGGAAAVPTGDGYCVYLTSVEIEFGWQDMNVYVPSEYPQGSCEYRAVLDHENQHVSIYQSVLREFAPRVRARVEATLSQVKPSFSRARSVNVQQALAPVEAQLSVVWKEFDVLHSARNARIDSPSNYAAVTAMCKNWNGPLPGSVPK